MTKIRTIVRMKARRKIDRELSFLKTGAGYTIHLTYQCSLDTRSYHILCCLAMSRILVVNVHVNRARPRPVNDNLLALQICALLPPCVPRDLIWLRVVPLRQHSLLSLPMDIRCRNMPILSEVRLSLVVEARNGRVLASDE